MDVPTPTPANDAAPPRPKAVPAMFTEPPHTPPNVLAVYLALDLAFVVEQLDELAVRLFEPDTARKRLSEARERLLPPLQAAIARARRGLERR